MELDGMISPTEAPASPTSPAEVASTIFPQSEWPPTICPEDFEEVPTIVPGLAEPEITAGTERGGTQIAPKQSDVCGGEGVQPLAPDDSTVPTPAREEPSCDVAENESAASSMAPPRSTLSSGGGAASGSAGPSSSLPAGGEGGIDGDEDEGGDEEDMNIEEMLDDELTAATMEERRERVKRRLEWSTPHTMRSMPTHPHDHRFVPTPGNPAEARLRKILDKKNERETKRKAKKREANRR